MTEALFVEAIRRGAYHRPRGLSTFACLACDDVFFASLREDVLRLIGSAATIDTTRGRLSYVKPQGDYRCYSLLTTNGDFTDTASAWSKTFVGKAFHRDAEYPALGRFIRGFPEAMNFTLRTLFGSSRIAPHEERDIHRLDDLTYVRVRLHLPIITNPESRMMLEGRYHHYETGKVYYFNNGCVHFATNPGDGMRVHLIWDCFLTRELFRDVFDQWTPSVRAPFLQKIGHYEDTGDVGPFPQREYEFNSWLGRLPDWTRPWFWNHLLRWAEFRLGKDKQASVHAFEEFKSRLIAGPATGSPQAV